MQLRYLSPSETFRQFKADSEWTVKAGVGGMVYALCMVLMLINILFFPLSICLFAVVQGYLITTIHDSVTEANSPLPKWTHLGELLIVGLTWMAIESLLCIITLGIIFGALLVGDILHEDRLLTPSFTFWAIFVWSFVMLLLPFSSLFTAYRVTYFANRQEIGAAFGFLQVLKRLVRFPVPLLQAWLLTTGLIGLALLLPTATIIGVFLLPSTVFIAQLIGARILAQAWRITSVTDEDPPANVPQQS